MRFKSWRDYYIFARDFMKHSCLNCKYGGARVDLDSEHSDFEYASVFCTYNISIVRFDFQTLCVSYVNEKTFKELPKEDIWNFKFPEKMKYVFDDPNKKWSIEEVREAIKDYESKGTDGQVK